MRVGRSWRSTHATLLRPDPRHPSCRRPLLRTFSAIFRSISPSSTFCRVDSRTVRRSTVKSSGPMLARRFLPAVPPPPGRRALAAAAVARRRRLGLGQRRLLVARRLERFLLLLPIQRLLLRLLRLGRLVALILLHAFGGGARARRSGGAGHDTSGTSLAALALLPAPEPAATRSNHAPTH